MSLTAQEAANNIRGTVCPVCKGAKLSGELFCKSDFARLSPDMVLALAKTGTSDEARYQAAIDSVTARL
jgi:hypothetical protein